MAGREADERDIRNKTKRRRLCRNNPRYFPCAGHRAGDPHLPVSALQHPLRLDEGDAAGRRLSVRVEIFLWLQPFLAAFVAATVLRTPSERLAAGARRRGGISSAQGYRHRPVSYTH